MDNEPKVWSATKPAPSADLTAWLDGQVLEAVTDFLDAGGLWISDGVDVLFNPADPCGNLEKRMSIIDLVDDFLGFVRAGNDGPVEPEAREIVSALRETLREALDHTEKALETADAG